MIAALVFLLAACSAAESNATPVTEPETIDTSAQEARTPAANPSTVSLSIEPVEETFGVIYRRLDKQRIEAAEAMDAERFAAVVSDPDQIAALDTRIDEQRRLAPAEFYAIDQVWEWASGPDWAIVVVTDTRLGERVEVDVDTGDVVDVLPARTQPTRNSAVMMTLRDGEWKIADERGMNVRSDPGAIAGGVLEESLTLDGRTIEVWNFPLEPCVLQPEPFAFVCLDLATWSEWRNAPPTEAAARLQWGIPAPGSDERLVVAITPRDTTVLADGVELDHESIRDGAYTVTAGTISIKDTFELASAGYVLDIGTFDDAKPSPRRSSNVWALVLLAFVSVFAVLRFVRVAGAVVTRSEGHDEH